MNLREALREEHSKLQTMRIVNYIGDNQDRFDELMDIFLGPEYRLTQRASWAVNYCAQHEPQLIRPYLEELIDLLEDKKAHNAVRRNVARLLQYVEIPAHLLGKVYSHCLDLFEDQAEPVAVRCFSLSVAANIAKRQPELINELKLVVHKHLPTASAGIKARVRKILSAKAPI